MQHRVAALILATITPPTLAYEAGRFTMQPEQAPPIEAPPELASSKRFGEEGSWWFTIGGLYAHDFDDNTDVNLHGAVSHFLVEDFEVAFELAAFGHFQERDDALGLNPNLVFRWHLLHDEDKDWTFYADAGIGLLFTTDEVPDGGTSVNFTPRFGLGLTGRLGDTDARWLAGLRWHHISNARISGEEENPSRDAPGFYAGLMFPF
ncbi:MAG: acyloxyacyl hydrolase [Planctomycetota bacterium]